MTKRRTKKELIAIEYGLDVEKKAKKRTEPQKNGKKDEDNVIRTSYYEDEDYILEQVHNATHVTHTSYTPRNLKYKYIVFSKQDAKCEEAQEFVKDNLVYKPIVSGLLDKGAIKLPSEVEDYGETSDLIKEIREYLYTYFEPPKFYEDFLPYYVLFTWVYEKFPFIAYLHFVGLTGTGKTVAAETVGNICYKSIDAAGSVTIASIFRIADTWRGTLFLDEFDLSSFGKEGYRAVLTFLKTGVSDRTILRVEGDKIKEVQSFSVKSPKIFTSETPIVDAGLQSRTFVIKMEKNKRKLPLYKLTRYEEEAEKLRNKLLLWRLHNLHKIDLEKIEFGFKELISFDRRVQQVLTPIYYLSDSETRKNIIDFAAIQEEETLRERRESLEGQTFQVIRDVYPNPVTLTHITEQLNKGRKSFLLTERKMGNVVRKILGFDIQRMGHDKISTLIVEEDRIKELEDYYGLGGTARVKSASVAKGASVKETEAEDPNVQEIFGDMT